MGAPSYLIPAAIIVVPGYANGYVFLAAAQIEHACYRILIPGYYKASAMRLHAHHLLPYSERAHGFSSW